MLFEWRWGLMAGLLTHGWPHRSHLLILLSLFLLQADPTCIRISEKLSDYPKNISEKWKIRISEKSTYPDSDNYPNPYPYSLPKLKPNSYPYPDKSYPYPYSYPQIIHIRLSEFEKFEYESEFGRIISDPFSPLPRGLHVMSPDPLK